TGDCDDTDPADDQGGCYGEQLGTVVLAVDADNEALQTTVVVTCVGPEDDVDILDFVVTQANTSFERSAPPTASDTVCRVTITPQIPVDFSGDGPLEVEVSSCGQTLLQVAGSVDGSVTESSPFVVGRCSGCADPTALNFDPSILVPTAT